MVSVVSNEKNLKRRINYFFSSHKNSRHLLSVMLDELATSGTVYLFGGVVRDLAIGGSRFFNSDIGIVFEKKDICFEELLQKYKPAKNKFGGYRFILNRWMIDIWDVESTWAFKEHLKEYKSVESLLATTITNWDSILFDWNHKKVICNDHYFLDLTDGYLDLVFSGNPNVEGMYVKIIHCYLNKNAMLLSALIAPLITKALDSLTHEDIVQYELSTYGKTYITKPIFQYLKQNKELASSEGSFLPVELMKIKDVKQIKLL
jgi:hypothetical protein